jgi:hypothetical protein
MHQHVQDPVSLASALIFLFDSKKMLFKFKFTLDQGISLPLFNLF